MDGEEGIWSLKKPRASGGRLSYLNLSRAIFAKIFTHFLTFNYFLVCHLVPNFTVTILEICFYFFFFFKLFCLKKQNNQTNKKTTDLLSWLILFLQRENIIFESLFGTVAIWPHSFITSTDVDFIHRKEISHLVAACKKRPPFWIITSYVTKQVHEDILQEKKHWH